VPHAAWLRDVGSEEVLVVAFRGRLVGVDDHGVWVGELTTD
jgi:hypothetical protein